MRIKKSWTIAAATLVTVAAIVTPLVVLFYPVNLNQAMSNYILQHKDAERPDEAAKKNEYIQGLMDKTSNILNDYKKQPGNKNASLDLWSLNLKSKQPAGELNYFDTLNRTMRHINPALGYKNILRTPQSTQEGYYNRNTEMMSFLWSPDYNGVGTWTGYMFSDTFSLANMWPPTYAAIEKFRATGQQEFGWESALWNKFDGQIIPGIATADNKLYRSSEELIEWVANKDNVETVIDKDGNTIYKAKYGIEDYYTLIGNVIGAWISLNSNASISETQTTDGETVRNYTNVGIGIKYVDWIASKNPNIPFTEAGPTTNTPLLVKKGFYKQDNPSIDTNYRDWYIRPDEIGAQNKITIWTPQDPFENTKTPWNPAFSQAPNTMYAGTVWTGLSSWTTIGDENDKQLPYNNNNFLVSNGIIEDITDSAVMNTFETTFQNNKTATFKIRPIPWVDSNGQHAKVGNDLQYLSPQDFKSGFKAFDRSIECGINTNNAYFVGLSGIDFKKTLADPNNNLRNTSLADQKAFTIHFNAPILTFKDTLDILAKQYFFALPTFADKVKNIVDDDTWKTKVVLNAAGKMDVNATDITQFYGCGVGKEANVWSGLYSAAPYYIKNVDTQAVTYELNTHYYSAFDDVKNKPKYHNFNLQKDGTSRIKTLVRKYAGSYNESIIYEQFKSKEIDFSPILASSLNDAFKNFNDQIKNYGIFKISQGNVFGYNLQIYEKYNEPIATPNGQAQNIIIDENGNPMWDPITRKPTYTTDQYGNYVFPAGVRPKLKSRVTQAYYDLIAKDFYTPGGISQTIRHTINSSINWVALKSLVTPGVNASIQYSFMPYGVYTLNNTNSGTPGEYWDYVANKRYDSFDPSQSFNIASRNTGNMVWTYDEMLKGFVK